MKNAKSIITGGYFDTCLETRFSKFRSRLGLVTPKSRLDLGPLHLDSRSRHCSDVSKAHRCCKYAMIFGKNRLFIRFFSHSDVMILF